MNKQWKNLFAAAVIVSAAPASAIPVTFDFNGTVTQVVNSVPMGTPTIDLSTAGQAFSAQFVVDTDLFSPVVIPPFDLGDRLAFNSELPGAVTPSLLMNGESIDLAPFSRNRANLGFIDSYGVISCGVNCSRLAPDQINLNVTSEDSTPVGPAALRSLSFSLVADPNFDNPELATEWFNFSPDFDITQLASLPLPDSLRVTVSLTDLFFECSEVRCQQTASQRTFFDVTSFSRTVASVPEPGALGLLAIGLAGAWFTRRRPAQPA